MEYETFANKENVCARFVFFFRTLNMFASVFMEADAKG